MIRLFKILSIFKLAVVVLSVSFCPSNLSAQDRVQAETKRFILYVGGMQSSQSAPRPTTVDDITNVTVEVLKRTDEQLERVFGFRPEKKIVLRFLSPQEFTNRTGAPAWTSAMYYKNEISIPIDKNNLDKFEIATAAKHEYVHAFLAAMTESQIPAWIDEGLAQLIEGEPNPVLGPALRLWIARNRIIPFGSLHDGFTTIEDSMVPAAYAQSLFATRSLINRFGISAIRTFLIALREGLPQADAFKQAFPMTLNDFETELNEQVVRWSKSGVRHP